MFSVIYLKGQVKFIIFENIKIRMVLCMSISHTKSKDSMKTLRSLTKLFKDEQIFQKDFNSRDRWATFQRGRSQE